MLRDLYLESLATIGINLKEHDVRFEEDNWEAPTLGAWGIGWQVLLDGLEITQFTYFQQSGGQNLDPISVELTYGLDRIAAYLQGVDNVFDVRWSDTTSYRQVRLAEEQQLSAYSFDFADAVSTRKQFELNEAEAKRILDAWPKSETKMLERFPLLAAYELTLKCSHLFNLLDARGAISVTERAAMIGRVRKLAVRVAELWLRQRSGNHLAPELGREPEMSSPRKVKSSKVTGDLLFEIGCEEIPAGMIARAAAELKAILAKHLSAADLVDEPTVEGTIEDFGAPRRLAVIARGIRLRQMDSTREVTGPPKSVAFDNLGEPTRAAMSFAEKQGIPVSKLSVVTTPKGEYVVAKQIVIGKPAAEILAEILPQAIRGDFLAALDVLDWGRTVLDSSVRSDGLWLCSMARPCRFRLRDFAPAVVPWAIGFSGSRAFRWTALGTTSQS